MVNDAAHKNISVRIIPYRFFLCRFILLLSIRKRMNSMFLVCGAPFLLFGYGKFRVETKSNVEVRQMSMI